MYGLMTLNYPHGCPSDKCVIPAEQYVLILCADGTLSGCNINLRNLVTMWTVPGRKLPNLQSVYRGLIALPSWNVHTLISSLSATVLIASPEMLLLHYMPACPSLDDCMNGLTHMTSAMHLHLHFSTCHVLSSSGGMLST